MRVARIEPTLQPCMTSIVHSVAVSNRDVLQVIVDSVRLKVEPADDAVPLVLRDCGTDFGGSGNGCCLWAFYNLQAPNRFQKPQSQYVPQTLLSYVDGPRLIASYRLEGPVLGVSRTSLLLISSRNSISQLPNMLRYDYGVTHTSLDLSMFHEGLCGASGERLPSRAFFWRFHSTVPTDPCCRNKVWVLVACLRFYLR